MKVKKMLKSILATTLAVSMVAGSVSVPVEAADDTFNYVTIGASNTNGYGMRGYITEDELNDILSGVKTKDEVNVYGYQRSPEGAYTDLVRGYYEGTGETVNLSQLAISSMRVEEVRILLDESYEGDDYSAWRFTGEDGWFRSAEEGGIPALRKAYQDSISNADLITIDIGWNNFGVYVCNQLADYMSSGNLKWSADLEDIFETEAELIAAEKAKAIIGDYVKTYIGEGEMADVVTDIFAYSILGYMHHFDIVMEKIYALNPDADVVVLGIQNLLHGVVCDLNGEKVPLGQIFGNFVNMANYYASACSAYQDRYQYVKAGGDDEHVTLFLDDIKSYDGDAANLNQNMKDCFDYYDNDLFVQTRIDYVAAALIEEEYGSMLSLIGYDSAEDVVKAGKSGDLASVSQDLQDTFDSMYWPALYAAYDTLAVLVKEVASFEYVDANGLMGGTVDTGAVEDALAAALMDEIQENALAAADGAEYTVDLEKLLPDANTEIVAAMYIRFYMGNSFFAHPSEKGHGEIKDAIVGVINNPETETDQVISDYLAESMVEMQQLLCEARGHVHGKKATWEWTQAEDGTYTKATAQVVCTVCDAVEFGTADSDEITVTETAADCGNDGKIVYSASVVIEDVTYTSEKTVVIEATGNHDYVDGSCTVCKAADPDYVEPEEPSEPEQPSEPEKPEDPSVPSEPEEEEPEEENNWISKLFGKLFGNLWGDNNDAEEPEQPSQPSKPSWSGLSSIGKIFEKMFSFWK